MRHLANTPATLTLPQTCFDLVRPGSAVFGLSTMPGGPPAGCARDDAQRPADPVKHVAAGYRRLLRPPVHHRTARATLALVPLGYADGVPRGALVRAEVQLRGRRRTIAGPCAWTSSWSTSATRPPQEGDEVVLFGPGEAGEPTAQDWADALGTISYEIVTRFGGRTPRSYSGVADEHDSRIPASPG